LVAALNTVTGGAIGKTAPGYTNEQFVVFLIDVIVSRVPEQGNHVVRGNVAVFQRGLLHV
jgi:hypothetical protein